MSNTLRPRAPGVHHLGLSVRDLERSIDFYCDVLGAVLVRPPYDGDRDSFRGSMALIAIGDVGVDLFEHAANDDGRFDPARSGLDHLAFTADSREGLETWASWLDHCQVARSTIRDSYGFGWMFDFEDPDGIQLEFFFLDQEGLAASGYLTAYRED